MKKKIIALCLIVALAATAIVGASLAYFTDTDEAYNTFTVGNVAIELIEQERDVNGGLQEFTQAKKLLPIVGSAQNDLDDHLMPIAENYVDKMVTVKNTGSEDAYIRAYFAIPSALDNGEEDFNANMNVLHFNFGNSLETGKTTFLNEWDWLNADREYNYFETEIEGIAYNVYYADYYQAIAAGETTERFIDGVYLDKSFDHKDDAYYALGKELDFDAEWDWNNVQCPVFAVGVQAAGFDSADAAFTEAFGADYNPWN